MIKLAAQERRESPYRLPPPGLNRSVRPPAMATRIPPPGETIVFGASLENTSHYQTKADVGNTFGRALAPGHAPIRALLSLQAFWGLSDSDMLSICGLPTDDNQTVAAALVRYMKVAAVKARLTSLMVIRSRLSALLGGDEEPERRWLRTPWARLGGLPALDFMRSSDMSGLLAVEAQVRELTGT